jgi:hypothetical protein
VTITPRDLGDSGTRQTTAPDFLHKSGNYVLALIKLGINASFAGLWVGSPTIVR